MSTSDPESTGVPSPAQNDTSTADSELTRLPAQDVPADSTQPSAISGEFTQVSTEEVSAIFAASISSPLVPPAMLAEYARIMPGSPERLLTLVEREASHRQDLEKQGLSAAIEDARAERSEARLGQFLGFGIGVVTIVAGTVVAALGHEISGAVIGSTGVVGLVSAFIIGRLHARAQTPQAKEDSDEE